MVKRVIFESILTPILTYGAECWTTTTVTRSRIQAAEMKPLRTMIGKSKRDRIRNEHIRERIGVSSIRNKIEKAQLRWLGHLERMEEGRVNGLFLIGEVIDVTGWLGGYNFQWAWASGFAAGNA